MSFWVDIHAHLDDEAFGEDLPSVLARAQEAGVRIVVTAGTSLESSWRVVELVRLYPGVFGCVGVHPQEVRDASVDLASLETLLGEAKILALGEIGLDYFWDTQYVKEQKAVFAAQVELAERHGLPVVVHSRRAERDVFAILVEKAKNIPVVWHCFSGDLTLLRDVLSRGWYISLGGVVTYPKATKLREVAQAVPLERLFLETDAPYLPPQTRRGKRNEPAFLQEVAVFLARLRGEDPENLKQRLFANFTQVFSRSAQVTSGERGIPGE